VRNHKPLGIHILDETEMNGASSLHHDEALEIDLWLLRGFLTSYRDETKRRTQSGILLFLQILIEEN
jgi:hypothetical protein